MGSTVSILPDPVQQTISYSSGSVTRIAGRQPPPTYKSFWRIRSMFMVNRVQAGYDSNCRKRKEHGKLFGIIPLASYY